MQDGGICQMEASNRLCIVHISYSTLPSTNARIHKTISFNFGDIKLFELHLLWDLFCFSLPVLLSTPFVSIFNVLLFLAFDLLVEPLHYNAFIVSYSIVFPLFCSKYSCFFGSPPPYTRSSAIRANNVTVRLHSKQVNFFSHKYKMAKALRHNALCAHVNAMHQQI